MRQPNSLRSGAQSRGASPVWSKEWGLRPGLLATLSAHFNDHCNAQQSRHPSNTFNDDIARCTPDTHARPSYVRASVLLHDTLYRAPRDLSRGCRTSDHFDGGHAGILNQIAGAQCCTWRIDSLVAVWYVPIFRSNPANKH
ncbi:hypothetical protein DO65_5487 [Burkholderia pseudomallei]|nr:hypothetical protein DO65_5487 [Burkholderia pseudomallei]